MRFLKIFVKRTEVSYPVSRDFPFFEESLGGPVTAVSYLLLNTTEDLSPFRSYRDGLDLWVKLET